MKKQLMKKNLVSAAVVLTLSSLSSSAFSAEEVIVVTSNRMQQNINDILTEVVIINRVDIERIQPQSVIDLLTNISGIDFVQKGGHNQDASVFMRGTNANQTLILIDGIRVGSSTLGYKSISNISISQIEKIEIVKGPRAALWGSDAIGGVIQIFTRRLENGDVNASFSLGSNNTTKADVNLGFGNDTISNTLTYSKTESEGFSSRVGQDEDNDGYENDSLSVRGELKLNESGLFDWVAQVDKGVSEFDTSFGSDESHYKNHHWNLRYSYSINDWNNQFSVYNSRDKNFGDEFSLFETRKNSFSYIAQVTVSENISIGGGYELLDENVAGSSTQYAEDERRTDSVYLNSSIVTDSIIAELAVRRDDVEFISKETTVNVGLGFKLNKSDLISLNFGQGFKAPTFNDLYFPWGGNENLTFETSDNLELVYKNNFASGQFVMSLYSAEVENLIQWTPDLNGDWSPQNVGSAKMLGGDSTFTYRQELFEHKITLSYIDAEDESTGEQLVRRAKKHLSYDISHSKGALTWFAQMQHVGERKDFVGYLDAYVKANFGFSYEFDNQWSLNVKANDLFNEAPVTASGYNPIGREFYITVNYKNF